MSDSEKPKSWRECKQSIKHKWLFVPFIFPEWLCEQVSYFLGQWAFLDILGHAGRLTILLAVIFYFMEADERRMQAENQRKAKHYQAWQVIIAAQGQRSSGGRKDALLDLNRDRIPLDSIDISKAFLPQLNLKGARLYSANLSEAILYDANFSEAKLEDANLVEADLTGANFTRAHFWEANLTRANLQGANLTDAEFGEANLTGTDLKGANLDGAFLVKANLTEASIYKVNLASTTLVGGEP